MAIKEQKSELLVGIFLLAGLALLGAIILFFGSAKESFDQTYELKVRFSDATGIIKGSDVRLGGAVVGEVTGLPMLTDDFEAVLVPMQLGGSYRIPEGSSFTIRTTGLLGDSYIQVKAPAPENRQVGRYVAEGATVSGSDEGSIQSIQTKVDTLAAEGVTTLQNINAVVTDVQGASSEIMEAAQSLRVMIERLDSEFISEENVTSLQTSIRNIQESSTKLGPLLERGGQAFEELSGALEEVKPALESFGGGMAKLEAAAGDVALAARDLREGEGLFAALLGDEALRDNVSQFMLNLKERGILRYKDLEEEKPQEKEMPAEDRGLFDWFKRR
ncbi:MAG: MlaD family protein [Verrucomicrobiota bacterium]